MANDFSNSLTEDVVKSVHSNIGSKHVNRGRAKGVQRGPSNSECKLIEIPQICWFIGLLITSTAGSAFLPIK